MDYLINKFNDLKRSNKIAVILCDNEKVQTTKTYKEICEISTMFEKEFRVSLKNDHLCVGLCMEKNEYLPSIILSLQVLHHSFVYIPTNIAMNTINVHYLLTFNSKLDEKFEKTCTILINNDIFTLWKISTISTDMFKDIFCVMRTSGSTGESKTIRIQNKCIESNAISLGNFFEIKSEDILFWGTPLSFDPSLIELLLALFNESTLVITSHRTYLNPTALYSALFQVARVTFLQIVPSIFLRWSETYIKRILCESELRILAFGGETFPKDLLGYSRKEDLRMFNLYGITELSCWATVYRITEETPYDDIPIGESLDETIVKAKNETNEVIESGEGTIFIGSNSRKCLINDELATDLPRFRDTEDLGFVANGNIYYRGRKNGVFKRFGLRVNLREIEEIIFKECQLTSKCVWSEEHKKLLCFILLKNVASKSMKEKILDKLRVKLLKVLRTEHFPDYLELLEIFPTNLHGKIDEKTLEEYYLIYSLNNRVNTVDLFQKLWFKYLGIYNNYTDSLENYSFFEMGGKSINIIQLITEFKDLSRIDCTELIEAVFERPLIECKNILIKHTHNTSNNTIQIESSSNTEDSNKFMKVLWKYDMKSCVDASPLIFTDRSNKVRIAIGSFGNIFAILGENGEEIYKTILTSSIECTPAVSPCKNFIYVGCYDGIMYCIDFYQHRTIWTYKTGDRIKCSPLFLNDARIVFGSYDNYLYCLSYQDGVKIWSTKLDGSVSSNLVYRENSGIFAATTRGFSYRLSEIDGKIAWIYKCESPVFGTPLYSKELLLVPSVSGSIVILSAYTGRLASTFQTNSHIFSSLTNFEDHVIFGCHDRRVYVSKIVENELILINTVLLDGEISSTPRVCQWNNLKSIIVPTNVGTVYSIGFDDLIINRLIRLPGEVFSSPVEYNNRLYVGCRDNNLYCLSIQ